MGSIRIQAEDCRRIEEAYFDLTSYRFGDADIGYSEDIDGGFFLGRIEPVKWLTDNLTVVSGVYQLTSRIASAVDATYIPALGQYWQAISTESFSLNAGDHQLRLDMLGDRFNLNYLKLNDLINGGNGNNTFNGSRGNDTITYASANSGIMADLSAGIVTHKFTTALTQPYKIMPLGDSNTEGYGEWDLGAYRDDLWQMLVNNGLNVDFVGPHATGPAGFDQDNAGFGGWRIRDISSAVNGWLDASQPDMVLLMIGTNDILRGDDMTTAPDRLNSLIDQISDRLPNTQLLVASIPPMSRTTEQQPLVQDFNSNIPGIVNSKPVWGKKVSFVDISSKLTFEDLLEGVHLTVDGYRKAANAWYEAIVNINSPQDSVSNIENIVGSSYDDILVGNAAANIIQGGSGNDILTGGAGRDKFVLTTGQGTDTITDYIVGEDSLSLSGGLTLRDITIVSGIDVNINDTWIMHGSERLALLHGVRPSKGLMG